jgi:hypothetical protein
MNRRGQSESGRSMASREARVTREETEQILTQNRLRPISLFSYVGQGRKGAKVKTEEE